MCRGKNITSKNKTVRACDSETEKEIFQIRLWMLYETDPLCRYEMRLGLAEEYPSDLIGKIWKHERRAGINFENKETHWTEDRLQSICPVLLPRLPPLVGDECWRKWLGEKRRKRNADKYVGVKKYTRKRTHKCQISLCWQPELHETISDTEKHNILWIVWQ